MIELVIIIKLIIKINNENKIIIINKIKIKINNKL